MPRPPSIQWYFKQYLGDNDVLKMEWDASGMHAWLLNLSIQEEPPGSIPNDMAAIRRWLRNPSDDVWRRVQPQIFAAWKLRDGRWFNDGMVRSCDRRDAYANRSKVRNEYETGTRITPDSMKTEEEVVIDVGSESKALNRQETALIVMGECHLSGKHFAMGIEQQFKTFSPGNPLKVAAELMIAAINRYREMGGDKIYLWLSEGDWLKPESAWFGGNSGQPSKAQRRQTERRENITAAVRDRYSGHAGTSSGTDGEGIDHSGNSGLVRVLRKGAGASD